MRAVPIAEILDANQVLATLIAFKKGDFSVRLPVNQVGLAGKIADILNDIFELNENMANEFRRVSTAVVNSLISDLVQPSTEIAALLEPSRCLQAGASD